MRWIGSLRLNHGGGAATFLKAYVVGGVFVLLAGFIVYSQWILHRLEARNETLVAPLVRAPLVITEKVPEPPMVVPPSGPLAKMRRFCGSDHSMPGGTSS